MKKWMTPVLLVLVLVALAFGPGALASTETYYTGKNAQKLDLFFVVEQSNSQKLFEPFFTNFSLTCPITGEQIGFEFIFIGLQVPMKNGRFNLEVPDLQYPFTWKGTVTSIRAKGTESVGFAAYDRVGGLQDCGSGSLDWHAKALIPPPTSSTSEPTVTYRVTLTRDDKGRIRESVESR
jgi:hypothetical protein